MTGRKKNSRPIHKIVRKKNPTPIPILTPVKMLNHTKKQTPVKQKTARRCDKPNVADCY